MRYRFFSKEILLTVAICFPSLVWLAPVPKVAAQECMVFKENIRDWTGDFPATPNTRRAQSARTIMWYGKQFLFINDGNGLHLWNVKTPLVPGYLGSSRYACARPGCPAILDGDEDWQLKNLSLCDDCRFGVANMGVSGTIVLDWGTDSSRPTFSSRTLYASGGAVGAVAFKHGETNFLILDGIENGCGAGTGSTTATLFEVVDDDQLINRQCINTATGAALSVAGGFKVSNGSGTAVYIAGSGFNPEVHIFQVTGTGSNTKLEALGPAGFNGLFDYAAGMKVDSASGYLVSANGGFGVKLYDISNVFQPVLLHTFREGSLYLNTAAVRYPFIWFGNRPTANKVFTYDITVPTDPQPLDQNFWLPDHSWNSYDKLQDWAAEFSLDTSALYLARFSVAQMISTADCGPGAPPVAHMSISPDPAFPGDIVTVTSTSSGRVDATAVWVTDELGEYVDGCSSPDLGPSNTSCTFTVPLDLTVDKAYTAHVAVENEDNKYNAQIPGDQLKEQAVTIDRTPTVQISVTPESLIAENGESVTLTATAEGTPAALVDEFPIVWWITDPSQGVEEKGENPTQVLIDASGTWKYEVEARYRHIDPNSSERYTVRATPETRSYGSVAAELDLSPLSPCADETIMLDASDTEAAASAQLYYQWKLTGVSSGVVTPSCSTDTPICSLPADTLDPDTYTVELTVTNTSDSFQSVAKGNLTVRDCSVDPAFSINTQSPEIGQMVVFTVTGVPDGGIQETQWNFGGPGCSGYSQTTSCEPGLVAKCITQIYKYSSAGTKNVTLKVRVADAWHNAVSQTVSVRSTGSCGDEPCAFSINPVTASFAASGGSGTVSITKTSGGTCTWTANENIQWLSITQGNSGSGNGVVRYQVSENTGTGQRTGIMSVAGKQFSVIQSGAASVDVDFTISNNNPDIGESITLVAGQGLTVQRWEMDGTDCDGNGPNVTCGLVSCSPVFWEYSSPGTKYVKLVTAEGERTRQVVVRNSGACPTDCEATARPEVGFTMSPEEPIVGDEVSFTYSVEKNHSYFYPAADAVKTTAGDFAWLPAEPKIAQRVRFSISGVSDIDKATWDFGEPGCDEPQVEVCEPGMVSKCLDMYHAFASAGTKTVKVTVKWGSSEFVIGPKQLTVLNEGSCGTTTCSYGLSRSQFNMDADGGTTSFNVVTETDCDWTASVRSAYSSWLSITNGSSGTGSGSVTVSATENTGAARTGIIDAAGKTFRLIQAAGSTGTPGDNSPEEWKWEIRKGGSLVKESSQTSFTHVFDEPGDYTVTLTVSNCFGLRTETQGLTVIEYLDPDNRVVPAAAHTPGNNDTMWLTDLRLFNADDERTIITLKYLADSEPAAIIPGFQISLEPNETRVFEDVIALIPLIGGDSVKGALLFSYDQGNGVFPSMMSRTYNSTPTGTYGQYVPAIIMAGTAKASGTIYLTGLAHNDQYRTNLGFANGGDEGIGDISIDILDVYGNVLGTKEGFWLARKSSRQLANVATECGVKTDLDLFTVRINMGDSEGAVYASVVDNFTGDPVLFIPGLFGGNELVVPGVAHSPGENESMWRSDVTFFNPSETAIDARVEYIPEVNLGYQPGFDLTLSPRMAYGIADIVSVLLLDETSSKGYLLVKGADGGPAPQVVARTYNDTVEGTYGQAVRGLVPEEWIHEGGRAVIPGIANAASLDYGFRTNVGLLNVNQLGGAEVVIRLYGNDGVMEPGNQIASKRFQLAPGEFSQFNVIAELGLGNQDVEGSLVIDAETGGPVVAYASMIDNRTGDPSLVPVELLETN